ncbi:hypothetical protein Hdeb2414_s0014g00425021 [Helianthus debilis subsp. tardiflorus]
MTISLHSSNTTVGVASNMKPCTWIGEGLIPTLHNTVGIRYFVLQGSQCITCLAHIN